MNYRPWFGERKERSERQIERYVSIERLCHSSTREELFVNVVGRSFNNVVELHRGHDNGTMFYTGLLDSG